tara:strand:+ start:5138 stop:12028 length:6891 start_codon:yes stop_codon:yes gene_type:complete
MPIKLPTVQTGYERSVQEAAKKVGKNLRINMGPGAKSVEGLTRPLGRLTGKADEFTKSMEAANARVLAFGASVGVIAAVSNGLKQLVTTSIEVEKSLTNINSILKQSESQLDGFKNQIFDIARNTGQTFDTVAEAALELSRQGLKAEEVTKRLNDALVLSRLSGLSAAESVAGLTAAVNSFSSAGLTTSDVLNKISAAAASAAVSDRDLIEGLKRSGAVAVASGVQFDELIGIISALQERTARGGAVIGNSLKTIFVRIQDLERLQSIQRLGVEVTDLEGKVLSSNKIIANLAPTFAKLDQAARVNLADKLVGKFQIAPFLALLEDFNQKISRSGEVATTSFNATNEAYERNKTLNTALATAINTATVSLKELANALGEIGVTENLTKIIGVFNSVVSTISGILDGDGMGSAFAKGLIKGISNVIAGPGLALALLAIGKLLLDFAKFGGGALKTFFGLNKAAEAQKLLQGQIAASLLNDKGIRDAILSIEKQNISAGEKKKLQTQFFTKALNEQLMVMQKMQGIAMTVAPGVMRGTASNRPVGRRGRAAGGFLPVGAERSDISRGVGGAPASAKPVVIPNFAFGGGKRGTMVANSSEYIVPNYANGGDAIFNQNMASSMGLPANARKVRAASGYIPNFAMARNMNMSTVNSTIGGKNFQARQASGKLTADDKAVLARKQQLDKKNTGKRSYMANQQPNKSIMLVPQPMEFGMNLSDHNFKGGPHRSAKNGLIDFFEGPAAGISKKLKKGTSAGNKFKKLLTLDEDIQEAIAKGVNTVFGDFKDASGNPNVFKTEPNQITGSNVKKIMEKGGPGALGAIKGATFEALMQAIVGGVSQKKGQLDVDFSRDKGNILDLIFGIEGKNFKFGDFKNNLGLKDKFARQITDNVQGKVIVGKKSKTVNSKTAASGYIPNFAEGALENAIGREKAAGLPVSQIRINQSGKLRNSQNPMGLAVTNTRDEPTGAIPNFAKGKVAQSAEQTGGALDKLTGKLFAFQSIMFLFQSGVGSMAEESTGASKAMFEFGQMAMQASMALMAFQMLGGMGAITGLAGKGAGLMKKGAGSMAAGRTLMTAGRSAGARDVTRAGAGTFLKGASMKAGGALLKLVAPLAIIAGGFAALNAINNKVTGSNEANKKALDDLTEAQKRAKKATEKLNVGSREEFQSINETLANADIASFKGKLNQGVTGAFDGSSDDEKFETLKKTIKAGYDSGMTQTDVRSILQNFANMANDPTRFDKKGEGINFRESIFGKLGRNIAKTTESGKLSSSDFTSLVSMLKGNIFDRSPMQERFETELRGLEARRGSMGPATFKTSREHLVEDFHREGKTGGLTMQAINASMGKIAREKNLKIAENLQRVERITLANAKSRLQTAIEVRKEHLKLLSADDKRLMKAQALGTLDDNSLLALKQRIEIQKIDNNLASKNLDFLNAQGDEMTRLKVEKGKIGAIENEILNISKEDLKDKDELLKIVRKIFHTNGLNDEVADSISESLIIQLDKNEDLADAAKHVLTNRQQETRELTKQTQLIKEIQSGTALTAQTELFGGTNAAGNERSRLEKNIQLLEARKDRATANKNDRTAQELTQQINSQKRELAIVANVERKATIRSDARNFFSGMPQGIQSRFPEAMKAMQDPNADPFAVLAGLDISGDKNLRALQASGMPTTTTLTKKADGTFTNALSQDNIFKLEKALGDLKNKQDESNRTLQDSIEATRDNSIFLGESSGINRELSNKFAPFSRAEAGQARRLAQAEANVDAGGGSVELELRRLTMERGVGKRFFELVPTDLENADKLSQSLADSSFQFAHNIGDAMLDAIQKGENLGDILLGTAADFLATMSRAFMDSAVNDFLGGFGIGKQAGGPIRGGSGTKDDVPAMLMGGEFVMNKKAVKKYGMGFMSALNTGSMQGFSKGGQVRDREGMFTTPGMNGAGKIVGAENLLSFATQTPIAMNRDTIDSSGAFLDAESGRLSMFGRRNSPQFQKVQDAKRQAFGLFVSEMDARAQAKAQQKANKKGLMDSLKAGVISLAAGAAMKSMGSGFKAARDAGASIPESLKSSFTGFDVAGTSYGGLKNIFSGRGFQSGPPQAQIVNPNAGSPVNAPAKQGFFSGIGSKITDFGSKMFEPFRNFGGGSGGGNNGGYIKGGVLPQQGSQGSALTAEELISLYPNVGVGGFPLNRATGGLIPAAGGVDTVPAMLSGGEFVMNAAATKNIGAGNLQALNSGAGTGDNTDLVSKLDELIIATETSQSTGDINITINGSNGAETETQGQNSTDQQKMLSDKIKTAVKQVIADEKRLGGQLRR